MINLIVALPAEAKPLNQHFGLKRVQPDGDRPIYRNGDIQLLLSGHGSEQAANACRSIISSDDDYWINVGIAGHPNAAVGELFQVNQVVHKATRKTWELSCQYPSQSGLITVDEPVTHYPENALYDMEAAGITSLLAESDQLAKTIILKIVSDNLQNPTTQISGRLVKSLINHQLETIDKIIHAI
jgi:hypothetical protein